MGRHSYLLPVVHYHPGDTAKVIIGAFNSIAAGVELIPGGNHRTDYVSTYPFRARWNLDGAYTDGHPWSKGDITIGNDVWIGHGSRVLGGVTIGDGAVVGAYSVLSKDVEPYAVVAGHPAKVHRYRFSAEEISALLHIAWWNWPDEVIIERLEDIVNHDIDAFVRRYAGVE